MTNTFYDRDHLTALPTGGRGMQFGPKTVLRHFSPKGHQPQSSTAPAVMFGASTTVRLTDRQAWRKEEYFSLLLAPGDFRPSQAN